MRFFDVTLATLPENLALDEALLLDAEDGAGGEALRLWQWAKPAVILGAGGVIADDVHLDACRADGVALARRSSGGGTVLLGPGCLMYTLVLDMKRAPELEQITSSYRWILGRLAEALAPLAAGVRWAGASDLAVGDRKCSGNAQQRKRRHVLHHGTLLYAFDFRTVGRYLKLPPRRPEYRGERDHSEFLINLAADSDGLIAALRAAWQPDGSPSSLPSQLVDRLVSEKYGRDDWVRRR